MTLQNYSSFQKKYQNSNTDTRFITHVGWDNDSHSNHLVNFLLSEKNLKKLQLKIANLLEGVHPENKRMIVSLKDIASIMHPIIDQTNIKNAGYIQSTRFGNGLSKIDFTDIVNDETITTIVNKLKADYGIENHRNNLSIWSTLYGEHNKEGLRAHAPIKKREKHPQYMAFNMKY